MKFRTKVAVFESDDHERPMLLTFINLAEDIPVAQFELKHSTSGYQWLTPSDEVTHATDFGHVFELRDTNKVKSFFPLPFAPSFLNLYVN